MRILADDNIPYAAEAFGHLGEVEVRPGPSLVPTDLAGVDVLLVRSTVRVDAALLAECAPRFVGTATIGTDHVDLEYLASRGIPFASAPGSNANSVAEYVFAALLELAADNDGRPLAGRTLGIVGVGNVGSRVAAMARALGMRAVLNDPPRARREGPGAFVELGVLLAESDIVTLHVPLTREGPDATHHLAGPGFFARLREGATFVNTSRGAVADSAALGCELDAGRIGSAVLDVWDGEPAFDPGLAARARIATMHIAGHSFDGKVLGTRILYEAACRALGAQADWRVELPPPEVRLLELDAAGRARDDVLREAVRAVYDVRRDDAALRALCDLAPAERGRRFDALRRGYPVRREFFNTEVALAGGGEEIETALAALGFRTSEGGGG